MGQRVVTIAGIPVLVPDDLDTGLPPARDPATFDAAPTPGVDIPDTASAQTVGPPMSPEEEARLDAAASADTQALMADIDAQNAPAAATGPSGIADPFAGQPPAPDAVSGADAATPAPAKVDVPVGDVVNAGGAALGGVGGAAVDVAQSVLTPNGIVGDAPPPPAAEPVPETPEEAQARREGQRSLLDQEWNDLDSMALATTDPTARQQIATRQGQIADQMKGLAIEEQGVAGQAVAAEQERVKAEAAREIARQEKMAAARARAVEVSRQQAEHHIAQIEEQANKPVDRSLGLGIGKSILLALSLVAGGLGSALRGQGDKNPALDILMRNIDQHVADQWARKKELWGQIDRIAKGMGEMGDQAAVRAKLLESYKTSVLIKAAKEMERVAKDLPAAKRAAALDMAAKVMAEGVKRRQDQSNDLAKVINDDRVRREAERNNRAQNRASLISAGAAATNARTAARKQKFEEDQYNAPEAVESRRLDREKKLAEIDKLKRDAVTDAEKKRLDTEKAAIELDQMQDNRTVAALRPTVVMKPDGTPATNPDGTLVMTVGNFKQPERVGGGDVNLKGNDALQNKTRTTIGAYEAYVNATDELINEVAANGWSSDTLKSDAYKKAQSLYRTLYLEGKDIYGLGALQAPDVKVLDGMFGGDPTALIGDPIVALRSARKSLTDKAYTTFKQGSDYRGTLEDFAIPERTKYGMLEAVKGTPMEDLLRQAEERGGADGSLWLEEGNARFGPSAVSPKKYPSRRAEFAISALAEAAAGAGPEAEQAKVQLRFLLDKEQHEPVRRYAAGEVQRTGADLGIPGFTKKHYEGYDLLRRAPGNTTGEIPFIPRPGTLRSRVRGALGIKDN